MDLNIIERKDCRSVSFEELSNIMKSLGQPSFRAKQVYEWLWKKSATTFDEMSNLPLQLRQQLNDHLCINAIEQDQIQKSIDGTVKVYRLCILSSGLQPILYLLRYREDATRQEFGSS